MEKSKSPVKDRRALMHYVELLRNEPETHRKQGSVHMTH